MLAPKKITICIFSALYLPSMGGVENYTYNLAKALIKLDYNVVVVTNNSHNSPAFEATPEGIEVYRLPCIGLINSRLPIPRYGKNYRKIKSLINNLNPNYVVINTRFYPLCLTAARFANRKKITPIVIEHGSTYLTLGNSVADLLIKIYEHSITKLIKRYHPAFYGVSISASKWLKTFNIKAIGELNNSIDADSYYQSASQRDFRKELKIDENDFVVSFIGRLVPEKGVANLVDAANKINKTDENIVFLFAGSGPLLTLVQKSESDNIVSLGKLAAPDIASLLKTSDVFCLPSRSEGFSTSLLEAAACYTAPIITNVGGVEELVPDESYGIVLKTGETNEIIDAILRLRANSEKNCLMGQNIGLRVRRLFSWKNTANNVMIACKRTTN